MRDVSTPMGSRMVAIVAGVALGLPLIAAGLRLAWINRIGGTERAAVVEPVLQSLHENFADPEARAYLRRLGIQAMPTITNYLAFHESPGRAKIRSLVGSQTWIKFRIYGEADYSQMAVSGVVLLKEFAGPYLVGMFAGAPLRYENDSPARRADQVLGGLGSVVVPALNDGLRSGDAGVRGHSALAIANHSQLCDAELIPNLIRCAADREPGVRAAAMLALGRVLEDAATSVPALAAGLADAESAVRFHAAHSLWAFGTEAKPALPALKAAIGAEAGRTDAGFDQQPLGPKSREMILHALTNAYATIREHGD